VADKVTFGLFMHSETEGLISRLRKYAENRQPFVWDLELRGELNCWNLLVSEGFVQVADLEQAIETWKKIEQLQMPTNPKEYPGYEYGASRQKRKHDGIGARLKLDQNQYYNALAYFLKSNLQDLKAYSLCGVNQSLNVSGSQRFKIFIIVGQTPDSEWICLSPTVPDQVWHRYSNSFHPEVSLLTNCQSAKPVAQDLHAKIKKVLENLKPIKTYGYYGDYSYDHQIFCTIASEESTAIELALKAGKLFEEDKYYFKKNYDGGSDEKPATQFVHDNFQKIQLYMFCFWDVGYGYKFGLTQEGEWVGLKYWSFMDYNP
jgi:hypothetical protein